MAHILFSLEMLFRDLRLNKAYCKHPYYFAFKEFGCNLIRPLFVKDWDFNEDFNCGGCGMPFLRRYLYCNQECEDKSHEV